jgi:hypothetical protein
MLFIRVYLSRKEVVIGKFRLCEPGVFIAEEKSSDRSSNNLIEFEWLRTDSPRIIGSGMDLTTQN